MADETTPPLRANLRVPMRDGVALATDVYLRAGSRPAPAVLLRTPYGRSNHLAEGFGWRSAGFAFVAQDVRGRYDSDGAWLPYANERADSAATVAWVASQPWCSGEVVVTGGSYAAFTAWAGAVTRHPAIRAVLSQMPAMGLHAARFDRSGILHLADHVCWWLTNGDTRTRRERLCAAMLNADAEVLAHLPVLDMPHRLWADVPSWADVVTAGPQPPPFAIADEELARVSVPVFHVGGWFDGFTEQTLHQWCVAGSAVTPRPQRRLVVGPWTHEPRTDIPSIIGGRDFGPSSRLPLGRLQVEWLRDVLEGRVVSDEARATVFLMGEDRWEELPAWAPEQATTERWLAAAGARLASVVGAAGVDRFAYDPTDPFPSISTPAERTAVESRQDAVRYTSDPLTEPLAILGVPRAIVFAATDAPATDWVARLMEVFPDGRTRYIAHGIVDAAQEVARAGGDLVLATPARFDIPMRPTAVTIPPGHRIQLEVTSSDFPEHARNLNTGADRYATADTRIAHQEIHFGGDTLTRLELPRAADDEGGS
jgi:putative CocE/NonD family hydrolase